MTISTPDSRQAATEAARGIDNGDTVWQGPHVGVVERIGTGNTREGFAYVRWHKGYASWERLGTLTLAKGTGE